MKGGENVYGGEKNFPRLRALLRGFYLFTVKHTQVCLKHRCFDGGALFRYAWSAHRRPLGLCVWLSKKRQAADRRVHVCDREIGKSPSRLSCVLSFVWVSQN